ncbi:MAG: serine acetyltransferase [Lewinellaceae bacterium]|nr:serine acetyltransferase [Phaeodactylibacter sp.]MCB9041882.1 serine acetyltransferase [Lewinellaceae bacterium]
MEEKQFVDKLYASHQNAQRIPSPSAVCGWLEGLLTALFPELANRRYNSRRELEQHYRQLKLELFSILETMEEMLPVSAEELEQSFLDKLPTLHQLLHADAEALLRGDPAAVSKTEVIRTYPGFKAIAVYRLAHEFHRLGVPLIPRILTEHVHSLTGIDIHPGARIGESFCMDHGTGIVIGETVEIGNDVKLYQGVTLGALSVAKEMAKTKRHPTIEDRVVIYAGATILGGETVIGHDSTIGGSVWLTKSVPPHSRIYYDGYVRQKAEV